MLLFRGDGQLATDKMERVRFELTGSVDSDGNSCSGLAAQPVLNHLLEITPFSCLAIDMGNDIANLYAGQLGRTTGHQLLDNDSAICPRRSVNTDTAEVFGIGCGIPAGSGLQHQEQCTDESFHRSDYNRGDGPGQYAPQPGWRRGQL